MIEWNLVFGLYGMLLGTIAVLLAQPDEPTNKRRCLWCGGKVHQNIFMRKWHDFQCWQYAMEIDLKFGFGRKKEIDRKNDLYEQELALLEGYKKEKNLCGD